MVSAISRYLFRFAVHLTGEYRANFLAEVAENSGATTRELADGRFEIIDFRPKKSGEILDALEQEQRRGALIIEDSNAAQPPFSMIKTLPLRLVLAPSSRR